MKLASAAPAAPRPGSTASPWRRRLAGALLACALGSPARAESLEEKLCLLLSAERLPAIPGIEIRSTAVTRKPPADVTTALVGYFPDPLRALDELNRRFGLAPSERDIAVRRFVARGEMEPARSAIVANLNGILAGGAGVEITIRAAGREATYGYACAWRTLKDVVTAPLGLLR